jgi:hypothetical protein
VLVVALAALGALTLSSSAHAASTAFADFGQLNVHGDAGGVASHDAITVEYDPDGDSYVVTDSGGITPESPVPGEPTNCTQSGSTQVVCERTEEFGAFSVHVDGHEGDDTLKAGYGGDAWHPADESGLVGGPGNDFIGASPNSDFIGGRDGHDLLDGAAGYDELTGGPEAGIDAVYGGPGSDSLSDGEDDGTADADQLDGGVCTDARCVDPGNEAVNDDDGISYSRAGGVIVNLTQGTGGQPGENDSLRNFESVATGDGADQVTGSVATNEIFTADGDDSVNVSADPGSADSVRCGAGADALTKDVDDLAVDCESVVLDAGGDPGGGDPGDPGDPGGGGGTGGVGTGGAGPGGGQTGAGAAAGGGAAQSSAADTTGPLVMLPSSNRTIAVPRNGRFGFRLGPFAEDVTGVVAARARKRAMRRPLKLAPRSFGAKAGQRLVVRFRLSRRGRRLLAKRRRIRMVATVTARDTLGNATTRTFAFTLKASG